MSLRLSLHKTLALQGGEPEIDVAGSNLSGRSFEFLWVLICYLGVPYASTFYVTGLGG